MRPSHPRILAAALLAAVLSACAGAPSRAPDGPAASASRAGDLAAYEAAARRNRAPISEADVRFVTGMIPHHAQALLFAGWAASHGAGPEIVAVCERIIVSQRDEIRTMLGWLREHDGPVPELDPETLQPTGPSTGHAMPHGTDHGHRMPGMLTEAQLAELDAARGEAFDRLFLTYMIVHHQGALTMVDELFGSYGAAQDDFVYKLASDIYADQSSEIERMQKMLDARVPEARSP